MSLRGKDKEIKGTPKYVRSDAGRVFLATPHLLDRDDMTPVYDEPEELKKTVVEKTKEKAEVVVTKTVKKTSPKK